jgi:hypothetical protein
MRSQAKSLQETHISPLAEAEIEELQSAGISPTPDEIVWLNRLAQQVEAPGGTSKLPRGLPRRIGTTGIWLWPFTLAGEHWWREHKDQFDELGDQEFDARLLAYALAHGRVEGHFDYLCEPLQILREVYKWIAKINASHGELLLAVNSILRDSNLIEGDPKDTAADDAAENCTLQDQTAALQLVAGQSAGYWLHMVSSDYAQHVLHVYSMQQQADGESNVDTPEKSAVRALGAAIAEIKQRHKKEPK